MRALDADLRLDFPDFRLALRHSFPLEGITALFGPSGSGKSTLLRILAGHERGAAGMVSFAGEVWQDRRTFLPPHRRGAGYMFQDARLFPHLTVRGNLAYAARRAPKTEPGMSLPEAVEMLDLGPLLDRRPQQLSGGERQRVALGRTLLSRPRLLLMDEPLAALDLRRKAGILPHIAALPGRFGIPVIYVTHAVDEVVRLADRMTVLSAGRLLASGDVAETLARLDLQTATGHFEAGAALAGRIAGHDPAMHLTRVDLGGQTLEMPGVDLPMDAAVRLHVRARDVALALRRPEGISIRNILEARIIDIAEEEGRAFAEVRLDIGGQVLRARLTRAAVADLALAAGMQVLALVKSVAFDRRALPAPRAGNEPPPR